MIEHFPLTYVLHKLPSTVRSRSCWNGDEVDGVVLFGGNIQPLHETILTFVKPPAHPKARGGPTDPEITELIFVEYPRGEFFHLDLEVESLFVN